ncbi:MAG TPA: amidase [Anaerolineae bacterium]|nr:amidase [Anaerolineae bacterium]
MPGYDLESLELPKLVGLSLRLFAAALGHRATRSLLLPSLLAQGGIHVLRAQRPGVDPTFYPGTCKPSVLSEVGVGREAGTPPHPLLTPAEVDAAVSSVPLSSGHAPAASDDSSPNAPGKADASDAGTGPYVTIRDYAAAYGAGTATPLEVAGRVMDAIAASEATTPPLRAIVATDREDVLAQARASAERYRAGRPLSRLDGVPVAIKDELGQAPYPTFVGTSFLGKEPAADSCCVARLRAAGALLIGKANMYELGLDPSGCNPHNGTARNPHNPAHDPGGSSSGPAAAVAAGLCPVALGCDGGGSIRVPAALCGVVGLKPTFGRVSEAGVFSLAPSVDAIGPIGATVADVAVAYGLIAGADPADSRSLGQPPVKLDGWSQADLRGLTLGLYAPWFRHAQPAVVETCEAMARSLAQAGAKIVEIEVPGLNAMRIAHVVTILSEIWANLQAHREHLGSLGAPARVTLALADGFRAGDYLLAQQVRTQAIATFEKVLAEVDCIITPTTAITAPRIPVGGDPGGWSDLGATTEKMRFVFSANLTGHPAISFPAGYDAGGLPVGMQAIGRYWDECTLLRVASAAERGVVRRRPKIFFSPL